MLFSAHDTLVIAGDSVTDADRVRPAGEGLFNAHGMGYVREITGYFDALYPQLDLRVINRGNGGNTSLDLKARWEQDVLGANPDWVAVMIGVNDVWRQFDCPHIKEWHLTVEQYREALTWMIETTLPRVKGMILMTPYYLEPNRKDPMRAELDKRSAVVRELAAQYRLPLADTQAAFDKLMEHIYPATITWDRVHPNQIGCAAICKTFMDAVGFDFNGGIL